VSEFILWANGTKEGTKPTSKDRLNYLTRVIYPMKKRRRVGGKRKRRKTRKKSKRKRKRKTRKRRKTRKKRRKKR